MITRVPRGVLDIITSDISFVDYTFLRSTCTMLREKLPDEASLARWVFEQIRSTCFSCSNRHCTSYGKKIFISEIYSLNSCPSCRICVRASTSIYRPAYRRPFDEDDKFLAIWKWYTIRRKYPVKRLDSVTCEITRMRIFKFVTIFAVFERILKKAKDMDVLKNYILLFDLEWNHVEYFVKSASRSPHANVLGPFIDWLFEMMDRLKPVPVKLWKPVKRRRTDEDDEEWCE